MKKVGKVLGKHKGITVLALILAVLIVALAVRRGSDGAAAGYSEEAASLRSITTYNSFVGNVTVASEMNVYPQASQTVTEVYVSEGDEVSKGDVIAQLDTSTVEYNISVQEAQLDSAKTSNAYNIADAQRTYENYKEAVDSGLNSSLQSAGNQVDNAYVSLMNAYENYEETVASIDNGSYSALSAYWTEKENAASAVYSAEDAVSAAEATVTEKENALASTQAALSSLQSSSSDAQSNLSSANSALTAAQTNYSAAETAYQNAQAAVTKAEAELSNAQTAYDDAVAAGIPDLTSYQQTVDDAQSALDQANAELTAAETELGTAQSALTAAQSEQTSAQSAVTNLSDAQTAVTTAQSELDAAKTALTNAQSDLDYRNALYNDAYESWYNQRSSVLDDLQDNIDSALLSYNQAVASYDSTELSVEQQLETYAANVDKTKATSSTETSELELENLEESLEDYTILAPCDGTITELDLEVGDTVSSGMSVATISSLDAMEISISVDEYSILNTGVGSEVTVYIDSIGKSYDGVITWVANAATVSGGVSYFEATVGFTPDDDVRVGMSVEVRLVTVDRHDVVSVAAASVNYHSDNTAYVLVQDESGNVVEKTVTLGESDGSYVEITDGLEEGDIILTTAGVSGLMDASAMEMMP